MNMFSGIRTLMSGRGENSLTFADNVAGTEECRFVLERTCSVI